MVCYKIGGGGEGYMLDLFLNYMQFQPGIYFFISANKEDPDKMLFAASQAYS